MNQQELMREVEVARQALANKEVDAIDVTTHFMELGLEKQVAKELAKWLEDGRKAKKSAHSLLVELGVIQPEKRSKGAQRIKPDSLPTSKASPRKVERQRQVILSRLDDYKNSESYCLSGIGRKDIVLMAPNFELLLAIASTCKELYDSGMEVGDEYEVTP